MEHRVIIAKCEFMQGVRSQNPGARRGNGRVEDWNIGIMGKRKKSESVFVYEFLSTQHSIIPLFQHSRDSALRTL